MGETLGYVGRIMLYNNPFDGIGFQIQICCLIISPAFISAGMYLTLKHAVISFGESWSRFKPAMYTYMFIAGDLVSLVLQGAGGGIAATADPGELQDIGTNLMVSDCISVAAHHGTQTEHELIRLQIAGVVFQVFVLATFGYLCTEYALRTYFRRDQLKPEANALLHKASFRFFVFAIVIAYLGMFIRCVYRIPELTGGWGSELMRNETDFIILEGAMIVMSVLVLTVFHPGFCFPALGNTIRKKQDLSAEKSTDEAPVV